MTAALAYNPLFLLVVSLVPIVVFGIIGVRYNRKQDKRDEEAAKLSARRDALQQVIDTLNGVIVNLQGDNKDLKIAIHVLTEQLHDVEKELDRVVKQLGRRGIEILVNGANGA